MIIGSTVSLSFRSCLADESGRGELAVSLWLLRQAAGIGMEANMKRASKTRVLLAAAAAMAALGGSAATAVPASAQDWNIPHNIHYPSFPECHTHMSPFQSGYGTMTCKGEYRVNRGNYKFTEENTNSCPAVGKWQRITLYYVLNPADGGVTWTKVLAGFSMHW